MLKNVQFLLLQALLIFQFQESQAQSGMALSLDGQNDYMSVADHSDLDIDAGESFTITLWVKTTGNGDFYRILSKRAPSSGPGYEMITQSGAGAYGMNLRSVNNTNAGPPFGTTSITDGSWHHLALRVDAGNATASILVDGNLEKITTSAAIGTQSFANDVSLLLGTNIAQSAFMNALLDDVRLWQSPLSDADIIADMTAAVDGSEPLLLAAWDFENVSGSNVLELKGLHPGTLFGGAIAVPIDAPMSFQQSQVVGTSLPVGRGETEERIAGVNVVTQGENSPLELTALQFNLSGTTDLSDLANLRVYYAGSSPRLSNPSLFGTSAGGAGTLTVSGSQSLQEGNNYFWIVADVADDAQEGNYLQGTVETVTLGGQTYIPAGGSASDKRLVILEHKLLFSGGDYGSANFRIPAIVSAADHSLVVAADARVDQAGDLPNNVDIVVRRSTDLGETWSDPQVIADFGTQGASDPALVRDRNTGDLLCMFASHVGLFQSTPSNPIRFQVCRSQDNGLSWTAPQEFTQQIYNPAWSAAWLASGSAHQLRSGRIVGVVGVRQTSANAISNFMIFSDDGGQSWSYSPNVASTVGDEAKIVELDNGHLMMNVRNQNPDRRRIVISEDGGQSWGTPTFQAELIDPFVNGDLIRYTSVLDGYDKSRLLFSIAAHPSIRKNLTLFLSYDEGATWPVAKVINPGPSGYSALAVLSDGTIGCFYENGEYEDYQLYFARVSLDWLSDGSDSFTTTAVQAEQPLRGLEFEVLPNPANATFDLLLQLEKDLHVRAGLFNIEGKEVMTIVDEKLKSGKHTLTVNTSAVAAGHFFVRLSVNGAITTRKISILR
jgi:hypothetical protein